MSVTHQNSKLGSFSYYVGNLGQTNSHLWDVAPNCVLAYRLAIVAVM